MILWRTFAPRAGGALAIVCLLGWLSGPLVQSLLMTIADSELGAGLSIESTRVSLFSTELDLTGVSVANPHDPEHELLSCQHVLVDVEGSNLARRKLVIRNATATGVRLKTKPLSATELSSRWPLPQHWKLHLPAQKSMQATLSSALAVNNPESSSNSQALALLEVLSASWPRQMLELETDLGVYELRSERLAEIAGALKIPSSSASSASSAAVLTSPGESGPQALLELKALETNVLAYRQRLAELRKTFASDRQRLRDLHEAELLQVNASSMPHFPSAQALSECFLGDAASQRSWEILRFVQWAREYLPASRTIAAAPPESGFRVAFPERHPLPAFVLRALHFEGQGLVADEEFHFAGTLQNLTNDPHVFGQPTRLVIDANIPQRVVVEAILDHTQDAPSERIVIRCPSWPQRAQSFGNPAEFAALAEPSLLSLRAELTLSAGNVSGVVQMRLQRLELSPQVADELGGQRVQASLIEMLSQIDSIDYQVKLSGPIDSPAMSISSPWGDKVAGSLQHAFEQELAWRAAELSERLSREFKENFARWEESTLAGQHGLQARLGTMLEQVQLLDALVQQQMEQDAGSRSELTLRPQPPTTSATERK